MGHTDTAYDVETPEGVVLKLRSAGLPVRFYAYLIDLLIRWGINLIVLIIVGMIGSESIFGIFLDGRSGRGVCTSDIPRCCN